MHTAPYFTAFGLLTILLSARVVASRLNKRVAFGNGSDKELEQRIRIFGNFTEYVPVGLVLLIALEFVQAPTWYLHLAGMTLLLGRMLHGMALGRTTGPSAGRVAGMIFTWVSLLVSAVGVSVFSLVTP